MGTKLVLANSFLFLEFLFNSVMLHTPYATASFAVLICSGVHQSKSVMLVLLITTKLPPSLTAITIVQVLAHDYW